MSYVARFVIVLTAVVASVGSVAFTWHRTTEVATPLPGSFCAAVRAPLGNTIPSMDLTSDDPAVDRARLTEWIGAYQRAANEHPECFFRHNPLPVPVDTAAVLLLVGTCLVGYFIWPYLRIRSRGLVTAGLHPFLAEELEGLRRIADVRVRFLVDPIGGRIGGVAFGHFGRRYILLERGLVSLLHTDPAAFRAVVLHELAHVRNRDLDVSYLTVLLWRTYLGGFVLPALVLGAGQMSTASVTATGKIGLWAQLAVLALLVLVNHNALIRERELAADAVAKHWGSGDGLRRIIDPGTGGPTAKESSWWKVQIRNLAALHPDPLRRVRALTEPGILTRPRPARQFALGLAVSIAAAPVILMVGPAVQTLGAAQLTMPGLAVPALAVVTVPAGFVFGLAVWQGRETPGRVLLSGLTCGAGVALGELLVSQDSPQGATLSRLEPATRSGYAALLLLAMVATTAWAVVCARTWSRTPGAGYVVAAGTSVLLTTWLPLAVGLRLLPGMGSDPLPNLHGDDVAALWPTWPVTALVVGALVIVVPLAGAVKSRTNRGAATSRAVTTEAYGNTSPPRR